jgi:LysR family transcriptional regulator, glycine cleavage system transcriptional activator
MSRLPPLGALRAFAAAGRHLSFQKAAAALAVTPTAISHQIKRLEDDLGVRLFRRLTRRLALTPAGQALLPDVAAAFDRLGGAVERLRAGAETGVLTVSSLPTLTYRWLTPRLHAFRAAHPHYTIRVEISERLTDFAREEEVDVAVRFGRGPWPGLASHFLFGETCTPLIAPALLERGPPLRKPADLLHYTLIREMGVDHDRWEVWLAAAGVKLPEGAAATILDTSQLAVQGALGGLGVAIVNPDFFRDEIETGRLLRPFALRVDMRSGYHLVYPEDRAERPKIAAFRDWMLAEAKSFVAAAKQPFKPAPASSPRSAGALRLRPNGAGRARASARRP